MTAKREMFCRQYVQHWNASRAAIDAGYSEKTAGTQGAQLLMEPDVINRIQQLVGRTLEKLQIKKEDVLRGLMEIATMDGDQLKENQGRLSDRVKALDALGKHFNIFEDHKKAGAGEFKVTINGKDADL